MSYARNLARHDDMRTEELDPARPSAAPIRHDGRQSSARKDSRFIIKTIQNQGLAGPDTPMNFLV